MVFTLLHLQDIFVFAIGLALGIAATFYYFQSQLLQNGPIMSKIAEAFPKALSNRDFVKKIDGCLQGFGYNNKSTLVATSFCCDEVNRTLEKQFNKVYADHFSMGGLAGFPFSGVTGFGAMAHHIPDGGSCLVVFGPHVGVDEFGKVGTVNRRGRAKGGACCGSAVAASQYVATCQPCNADDAHPVKENKDVVATTLDPLDAQQAQVGSMLLPYKEQLEKASDSMVELPYALYDAQKTMMKQIIGKASGAVGGDGMIALVGGIQINTPKGTPDHFLPLSFDLYNNKGEVQKNLLSTLRA